MKYLKLTLFLTALLAFYNSKAAYFPSLLLQRHYGLFYDTLSFPDDEAIMLAKADSLYFKGVKRDPGCKSDIRLRGYFAETPCIAFYNLGEDCGDYITDFEGPDFNRNLIFYNFCNKAVYSFGDSMKNFNAVFHEMLLAHFDSNGIMEYIQTFLDTRNSFHPLVILKNPQDFVALYDSLYGEDLNSYKGSISSKLINERKTIPAYLDALVWQEIDNGYEVKFYTWGGLNSITYWDIKISREGAIIDEEKTLFSKLGMFSYIR